MKQKYIHMVLLTQGPTQPDNDINTYLELLKELEILWKPEGVKPGMLAQEIIYT